MSRALMNVVLCAVLSMSCLPSVTAQSTSAKPSANQRQGVIDRKELESFLDKFFDEQMPKYKVPSAVFVNGQRRKSFPCQRLWLRRH